MFVIYLTVAISIVFLLCTTKGQQILSIYEPELYDFILIIFLGFIWPTIIVFFIVGMLWECGLKKILDKPIQKVVELILGRSKK